MTLVQEYQNKALQQKIPAILSNSISDFQLRPQYPESLPYHFYMKLLYFLPPKTQSCFDCRQHLQKYITNESHDLLENARDLVLVRKARKLIHPDQQGHLQYTTD